MRRYSSTEPPDDVSEVPPGGARYGFADDRELEIAGQRFLQLGDARLHAVDEIDGVRAGLFSDDERDGVFAVEPRERTRLLDGIGDGCDILEFRHLGELLLAGSKRPRCSM